MRDNDIGWAVEAIKTEMSRKMEVSYCTQSLSETDGKSIKVKVTKPSETKDDFEKRTAQYADIIYPLLLKNIAEAIDNIYVKDLGYHRQTKYPKQEQIDSLMALSAEYSQKSLNNKINETFPDWESEAKTNLFIKKRSAELAKLLATRMVFNEAKGETNRGKLIYLLSNEAGKSHKHRTSCKQEMQDWFQHDGYYCLWINSSV